MQAYNDLLLKVKKRERKTVKKNNSFAKNYLRDKQKKVKKRRDKQKKVKKRSEKNDLKKKITVTKREKRGVTQH